MSFRALNAIWDQVDLRALWFSDTQKKTKIFQTVMSQKHFPYLIFCLLFILCLQIWKQDEFTKCMHPKMIQKVIQNEVHIKRPKSEIKQEKYEEKNLTNQEPEKEVLEPIYPENREIWTVLIFSKEQKFRDVNDQYYSQIKSMVHYFTFSKISIT